MSGTRKGRGLPFEAGRAMGVLVSYHKKGRKAGEPSEVVKLFPPRYHNKEGMLPDPNEKQ